MYPGASNFVNDVDMAFYVILGISFFFFISLTATMIYFIIRYNRKRHPKAIQIEEKASLEITWIVVPTLLVLLMFYFGWKGFFPMREVPKDAYTIKVVGMMWQWKFEYPNGKVSEDLVLPFNKPVRLDLISTDVIHGFFIPAFRVKHDVVPGKRNFTWFIPQQVGDFDIFCSAYCGVRHAYMHSFVKVYPQDEFERQLALMPDKPKESKNNGMKILQKNGCVGCHSSDGTVIVGPTFKGLYGSSIKVMTNGTERSVTVDDEYIKNSVFNPNDDIVKGFNQGLMKSYKGIVKEDEIPAIIDYLKTLK